MLRRAKRSYDPNNTQWSRSSTKFGQRILESQGWKPGDYLGAHDAPHTKLHSAANASHIRITLKDDNLGLGARKGATQNESTGLNVFQDLLGRLNGKSEANVGKEQKLRDNLWRDTVLEQRWGKLRFVSGGFLVGDKPQGTSLGMTKALLHARTRKERKNSKRVAAKTFEENTSDATAKRKLEESDASKTAPEVEHGIAQTPYDEIKAAHRAEKGQRRAEKVERKLQRKRRRKAKSAMQPRDKAKERGPPQSELEDASSQLVAAAMEDKTIELVPSDSALLAKNAMAAGGGRRTVRQRYIRQKRMSIMDSTALNEVCV